MMQRSDGKPFFAHNLEADGSRPGDGVRMRAKVAGEHDPREKFRACWPKRRGWRTSRCGTTGCCETNGVGSTIDHRSTETATRSRSGRSWRIPHLRSLQRQRRSRGVQGDEADGYPVRMRRKTTRGGCCRCCRPGRYSYSRRVADFSDSLKSSRPPPIRGICSIVYERAVIQSVGNHPIFNVELVMTLCRGAPFRSTSGGHAFCVLVAPRRRFAPSLEEPPRVHARITTSR